MTYADLTPLANHLWQSTVFAGAMAALTFPLKRNRAAVRYWLWLAASVKFLVPFSLLVGIGSQIALHTAASIEPPQWSFTVERISQPFTPLAAVPQAVATSPVNPICAVLLGVWLCGITAGIVFWLRCWRQMRAVRHAAIPLALDLPVPVLSSAMRLEPGVFGICHPVLLLPEGIADRLTVAQLETIIAHEMCHVRRRDNLTAAIHMTIEVLFWFHPLLWWIRTRLVAERERACDEAVLLQGTAAGVYAESILQVCRHYVASPAACVSGVTGADLKLRVATIMSELTGRNLTLARKFLLTTTVITAIAGPLATGMLLQSGQAQERESEAAPLSFEAASIKPVETREGPFHFTVLPNRLDVKNLSLGFLILQAYDLPAYALSGPEGLVNNGFDIAATSGRPVSKAEMRAMLQGLLIERFHLSTHWETRTQAAYRLVVLPGGPRMKVSDEGYAAPNSPLQDGNSIQLNGPMSMRQLSERLTRFAGKPVVDATNLEGYFTIKLTFASDDYDPSKDTGVVPPLLTKAVEEQLGLKLVPGKEPIKILVVDHVDAVPVPN
jgi:uncharacterized protein (TIGR03435 family)